VNTRPQLLVDRTNPAAIVFSLESPTYEPGWEIVLITVVTQALRGHAVLGLSADPPVWDLEFAEVSAQVARRVYDGWHMALLTIVPDDHAAINIAVASTDFQLGTLLLAAIPTDNPQRVEAFAKAVQQAGVTGPVTTDELFLECSDNTWLSLLNPSATVFDNVRAGLESLVAKFNWELVIRSSQGDM